jgi:hypothetical protein
MEHRPARSRVAGSLLPLMTVATAVIVAAPLHAQQPATQPAPAPTPEVGTMAPDFTLSGATRFGLLQKPVKLSELRGQTVVLAFFFQARTKG